MNVNLTVGGGVDVKMNDKVKVKIKVKIKVKRLWDYVLSVH